MTKVDLKLTPTGRDSKVILDGVDVSKSVSDVEVHAGVGEVTTVMVTYVCAREDVDVEGEFDVVHVCPIGYGGLALAVDREDDDKARWLPEVHTFIDRGGVRRPRANVPAEFEDDADGE